MTIYAVQEIAGGGYDVYDRGLFKHKPRAERYRKQLEDELAALKAQGIICTATFEVEERNVNEEEA
jgi:hypothetical protein